MASCNPTNPADLLKCIKDEIEYALGKRKELYDEKVITELFEQAQKLGKTDSLAIKLFVYSQFRGRLSVGHRAKLTPLVDRVKMDIKLERANDRPIFVKME